MVPVDSDIDIPLDEAVSQIQSANTLSDDSRVPQRVQQLTQVSSNVQNADSLLSESSNLFELNKVISESFNRLNSKFDKLESNTNKSLLILMKKLIKLKEV